MFILGILVMVTVIARSAGTEHSHDKNEYGRFFEHLPLMSKPTKNLALLYIKKADFTGYKLQPFNSQPIENICLHQRF